MPESEAHDVRRARGILISAHELYAKGLSPEKGKGGGPDIDLDQCLQAVAFAQAIMAVEALAAQSKQAETAEQRDYLEGFSREESARVILNQALKSLDEL